MPSDVPDDDRPYLCIPYWTSALVPGGGWDNGQVRALPAAVVSYACESIHTGPYRPGVPLEVSVDVRNSSGTSSAMATVVVYWSDPTVGFAKPTFFAATSVAVPPTRNTPATTRTPTMIATIPASAPAHVCLLVAVSHPKDRAGTVCDPITDRHWAQRNLQSATVAPGAPAIVPVFAANPFPHHADFQLRAGPLDERHIHAVAGEFDTHATGTRARLRLLDEGGRAVSDEGEQVTTSLALGPLERRGFQVLVELDDELPPGSSTGVEATLIAESGRGDLVGSLGVALLPPAPTDD